LPHDQIAGVHRSEITKIDDGVAVGVAAPEVMRLDFRATQKHRRRVRRPIWGARLPPDHVLRALRWAMIWAVLMNSGCPPV
jgi:hypothetical protein